MCFIVCMQFYCVRVTLFYARRFLAKLIDIGYCIQLHCRHLTSCMNVDSMYACRLIAKIIDIRHCMKLHSMHVVSLYRYIFFVSMQFFSKKCWYQALLVPSLHVWMWFQCMHVTSCVRVAFLNACSFLAKLIDIGYCM